MQNSEEKKIWRLSTLFSWMASNSQVLMISFMRYWDDKSCLAEEIYDEEIHENTKIPLPISIFPKYHYQLMTKPLPIFSKWSMADKSLEDQWKKWKEVGIPTTPTKCHLKGFWQRLFCNRNFGNTKHTLQLIIVEVAMPFLPKTINVANMKWQHLRWRWVW